MYVFGKLHINSNARVPSPGQRQRGKISHALIILDSQWRSQLNCIISLCKKICPLINSNSSWASKQTIYMKCKHCGNSPVCFRGRESPSTSELRSWWQISGALWRPEERETSSTWTGSPCSQTTGSLRLSSTWELFDTLMHWCRHWRTVRQECAFICFDK